MLYWEQETTQRRIAPASVTPPNALAKFAIVDHHFHSTVLVRGRIFTFSPVATTHEVDDGFH
jgi:hypothetical protein